MYGLVIIYAISCIISRCIKYFYRHQLAEALLERETLTYDDVEKLIGPPPFGKKRLVEPAEFEESDPARESPSIDRATV